MNPAALLLAPSVASHSSGFGNSSQHFVNCSNIKIAYGKRYILIRSWSSANCLPTYINFFDRFQKFRTVFEENSNIWGWLDKTERNDAQNIRSIIDKVLEEFQFHNTPDTIAKKHFHCHNGSSNLTELKDVLILFLYISKS